MINSNNSFPVLPDALTSSLQEAATLETSLTNARELCGNLIKPLGSFLEAIEIVKSWPAPITF